MKTKETHCDNCGRQSTNRYFYDKRTGKRVIIPAQQIMNLREVLFEAQELLGVYSPETIQGINTKVLKSDIMNAQNQLIKGLDTLPLELFYDFFMDLHLIHSLVSVFEGKITNELMKKCYNEPNKESGLKGEILRTIQKMEDTHGEKIIIK